MHIDFVMCKKEALPDKFDDFIMNLNALSIYRSEILPFRRIGIKISPAIHESRHF